MRLLLLTLDPPTGAGGIEGRTVAYTSELLRREVHVEVAALASGQRRSEERYYGTRLVRLSSSLVQLPRTMASLVRMMSGSSLDSVFMISGGSTTIGMLVLFFTRLTGRRSGVFFYGRDVLQSRKHPLGRLLLVASIKLANGVGANSSHTARLLPTDPTAVTIVYPGVDSGIAMGFSGADRDPSSPTLLFVGRLVERKGADLLLHAFRDIGAGFPRLRLDIVGDGPEMRSLVAQATSLGLGDRVTFHGAKYGRDLWELYARSSVLVLPARESPDDVEGFGTVFLEAGAFGVPSVGTRTGGIPEAIVDGVTGKLVNDGDLEGLGREIEGLLKDSAVLNRLGENARGRAREFSWSRSTDQVLRLLGEGLA